MTLKSIIDPKKKARVLDALKKGDPSMLKKKPLAEKSPTQMEPNPESQDKLNRELLEAASKGNTQKVKDLLQKGADVDAKVDDEWTPVIYATVGGHTKTVGVLIRRGAEVNARSSSGKTPLEYALLKGHAQIIELLKKHGAEE